MSLVSVEKKAVGDMKQGSFSAMMLVISRLSKFKVIVGDMLNLLMENDNLKKFCKKTAGFTPDGNLLKDFFILSLFFFF